MCRRRASPSTRYLLDCWDLESRAFQGALPRQLTARYRCLRCLMLPKEISRRWIGSVVTFRWRGVERERKRRVNKFGGWESKHRRKRRNKKGKERKGKERKRKPERSRTRTRLEDKRGYTEKAKAQRGGRAIYSGALVQGGACRPPVTGH